MLNPRQARAFFITRTARGGGGWYDPPGVSLLIDVELRGKNQRAARHERKRLVPDFKVIGHLVTFEVRSKVNFRQN